MYFWGYTPPVRFYCPWQSDRQQVHKAYNRLACADAESLLPLMITHALNTTVIVAATDDDESQSDVTASHPQHLLLSNMGQR